MGSYDDNIVPVRSGQNQLSGSDRALFETIYAAEVLALFPTLNIMKPLHRTETIMYGKSETFPLIGTAQATYHVAGTPLLGNEIAHGELTINIDGLLISHVYIYDLFKAMQKKDFRADYVREMTQALSDKYDKQVLQTTVLGARALSNLAASGQGFGGTVISNPSFATDPVLLAGALRTMRTNFNRKNVPMQGRYAAFPPEVYELLAANVDLINRNYAGTGSIAEGDIVKVAGFQIVESNNVPQDLIEQETGTVNTYHGDFSDTLGVCWQTGATATVELMQLTTESSRDHKYKADLIDVSMAIGHGILNPAACGEISKAAST